MPPTGLKSLKRMTHGPLTFHWERKQPQPVQPRNNTSGVMPIDLPEEKLRPQHLAEIYDQLEGQLLARRYAAEPTARWQDIMRPEPFLKLAVFLHRHSFSFEGLTFRFVTMFEGRGLNLGLQVARNSLPDGVTLSVTPQERRNPNDLSNGQYHFSPFDLAIAENFFSTNAFEGLLWLKMLPLPLARGRLGLLIFEVQEDKHFLESVRQQRVGNNRLFKILRWSKHFPIAALEELAPGLGFELLMAKSREDHLAHVYDRLFGDRLIMSEEAPLYSRISGSEISSYAPAIDQESPYSLRNKYYWLYQNCG